MRSSLGGYHEADPETAYFDTSCKTCIGDTNSHMPCFSSSSFVCCLLFKMSCYRDCPFLRHLVSPPKCHVSVRKRHLGNASAAPMTKPPDQTRQGRQRICFGRSTPWEKKPRQGRPCLLAASFARSLPALFGLALASSNDHVIGIACRDAGRPGFGTDLPVCLYIDGSLIGRLNLEDL